MPLSGKGAFSMITDEELKEALREVMELQLRQIDELGDYDYEFSPRFEKRMKRLFKRCGRRDKIRRFFRKLKEGTKKAIAAIMHPEAKANLL